MSVLGITATGLMLRPGHYVAEHNHLALIVLIMAKQDHSRH